MRNQELIRAEKRLEGLIGNLNGKINHLVDRIGRLEGLVHNYKITDNEFPEYEEGSQQGRLL